MNQCLLALAAISTLGLALSVSAHILSWAGVEMPTVVMGLHVAAMVCALPAILAGYRLTRDYPQRDYWKVALRGCPPWMRRATYGFFGYAIVNFILFVSSGPRGTAPGGGVPPEVVRGFSGHWMAFFAVSAALLYSSAHAAESDDRRRCLQGHRVREGMKFCGECGSPVASSTGT